MLKKIIGNSESIENGIGRNGLQAIFSEQFTGIFYGIGVADFAILIGFILWMLIFLVSLDGIELTDIFCRMLYTVFCVASGTALCIAIPRDYIGLQGIHYNLVFMLAFAVIATIAWGQRKKRQSESKSELRQKINELNKKT